MTVIATASNPRFTVSRVDVDRTGATYTIDTLRELRDANPDAELFFITGADALEQILTWKDDDELWDLAHFVGVTRPGHELSDKGLPTDRITLWRCPPWRSAPPTAGLVSRGASRSGTSCPTVSSSTSTSTACTPRPGDAGTVVRPCRRHHPEEIRDRNRALQLARVAALAAEDKIAQDVMAIDVSDQLALTDVFVIASAGNERQVGAIVDEIEDRLRDAGVKPIRREGAREGRWVLIDFGDIVVHVQHADEREFYQLERLWKDCPEIDLASVPAP